MKPEEELESLIAEAQRGAKARISALRMEGEDAPAFLAAYIENEKPEAVLLSAFAAMELRPLAENYPQVRFCVFDAPKEGIPRQSPFIWVLFDAEPAIPELGAKIRGFLESSPPGSSAVAFLEPAWNSISGLYPVFDGLPINLIQVSGDNTAEFVRGRTGGALSLKPVLYILSAGIHTSLIFDLIRQQGGAGRIVLDEGAGIPAIEGFPVLASLERSYPKAIKTALLTEAARGEVLRIPVEIR
jgi:hypothetical protein